MRSEPLLTDAEFLLSRLGRPTPETTGRAISNAYYALFHGLKHTANRALLGATRTAETSARWFDHSTMRAVCTWFNRTAATRLPAKVTSLLSRPGYGGPVPDWLCSPDTKLVADAFVELQEARHRADYSETPADRFTKLQATQYIERARLACAALSRLSSTEDGRLFLLLLLTGDKVISDR
jgi:uncharacterized protein (UPF0332 family)